MKMEYESEEEEKVLVENRSVGLTRSSSTSDSIGQPNAKDVAFADSDNKTMNGKNNPSPSSG